MTLDFRWFNPTKAAPHRWASTTTADWMWLGPCEIDALKNLFPALICCDHVFERKLTSPLVSHLSPHHLSLSDIQERCILISVQGLKEVYSLYVHIGLPPPLQTSSWHLQSLCPQCHPWFPSLPRLPFPAFWIEFGWLIDFNIYTVYSRASVSNTSSLQTSRKQGNLYSSTSRINLLWGQRLDASIRSSQLAVSFSFPRNGQGKFLAAFLRFFGESSEAGGAGKRSCFASMNPSTWKILKIIWDHWNLSFFLAALLLQMIH